MKNDLQLKSFWCHEVQFLSNADKLKQVAASKCLLRWLTKAKLAQTWFSDEKVFTVQTPTNSQNDRVYANVAVKCDVPVARLLKSRKHFSHSIMVSIAVSNLGKMSSVFVQLGAKVDSFYYHTVTSFWIRVYYWTFRSYTVITSLFNSSSFMTNSHVFVSSCARICGTRKLAADQPSGLFGLSSIIVPPFKFCFNFIGQP